MGAKDSPLLRRFVSEVDNVMLLKLCTVRKVSVFGEGLDIKKIGCAGHV